MKLLRTEIKMNKIIDVVYPKLYANYSCFYLIEDLF